MAEYVTPSSTLASLIPSSSNVVDSSGVAGTVDTTYQPNCVRIIGGGTGDFAQTMPFIGGATPTTAYFHFDLYVPSGAATYLGGTPFLKFLNSAGTVVAQLLCLSGGTSPPTMTVQYYNGSSYTGAGAVVTLPTGGLIHMDIAIVCGASGSIQVRIGGVQVSIINGLNAAVTNLAAMQMYNPFGGSTTYAYYSQVQAADFDLRDYRGQAAVFNALGSFYTSGTGAITDVTDSSDATMWSLSAAGGRGATTTALSAIGGMSIYGAYLNGRMRVSGGVVTNATFGFRDATPADNASANLNPNGGFEPRGAVIKTFSGAAVTYSSFNAAEKFVKAA